MPESPTDPITVHSVCPRCREHENLLPFALGWLCTQCGFECKEPERWLLVDDALRAYVGRLLGDCEVT